MSVINWAEKPYPWNEIGLQWVDELQKLAKKPVESRTVQEPGEAATYYGNSVYTSPQLPPVQRGFPTVRLNNKHGMWG